MRVFARMCVCVCAWWQLLSFSQCLMLPVDLSSVWQVYTPAQRPCRVWVRVKVEEKWFMGEVGTLGNMSLLWSSDVRMYVCVGSEVVPHLWNADISLFSLLQAMVETVNNLLQERSQAAWRELSVAEQLRCATMLLDTVETGAFMLADNLLKTDTIQESTDNIREFTKRVILCACAFTCESVMRMHILHWSNQISHSCLPLLVLISLVTRRQITS